MLVCAPWLLGTFASRVGGAIVVLFGQPLAGILNTPVRELMDLFKPRVGMVDPPRPPRVPDVDADTFASFFRWWVERLNHLWAIVLDPARFADAAGSHDPGRHFVAVLSMERLFTSLQALLAASYRDEMQRRALLFNVLDLLEGLRFGDFRTLLTLRHVKAALERVRSAGAGIASPALTKCEAAVESLERVADGFYLKERIVDGRLKIKRKKGGWEEVSMENAVAGYVRVLRNSTHSFMGATTDQRDMSLLASHTGELPTAVPDLALLHVLDLLLKPERIFTGAG